MTSDALFQVANPLALAGWIVLLASPLSPKWADRIAGYAIPLVLSVGYTALILAFWSSAEGGFGSLADVMLLFTSPSVALGGWVHYLAFDLFVGAWETRKAREAGMPHLMLIPCLALTFLFGPIGLLMFLTLRAALSLRTPAEA